MLHFWLNEGWSPKIEMYLNAIPHILVFVLLLNALHIDNDQSNNKLILFTTIVASIPAGWQNMLWGMQSNFYFLELFSIYSLLLASRLESKWFDAPGSIIFSVLSYLSLASGAITAASVFIVYIFRYYYIAGSKKKLLLISLILITLIVTEILLTPTIEHHKALRAHNFIELIVTYYGIMSWPLKPEIWNAALIMSPSIIYTVRIVSKDKREIDSSDIFFIGLMAWSFGQAVSLAYGRSAGAFESRYKDLFTVFLIVNFYGLLKSYRSESRAYNALFIVWILSVSLGLTKQAKEAFFNEIPDFNRTQLTYLNTLLDYSVSNNKEILEKRPIPYHSAELLLGILKNRNSDSFLPASIKHPLIPDKVEITPNDSYAYNSVFIPTQREIQSYGNYKPNSVLNAGSLLYEYNNLISGQFRLPVAGYYMNGCGSVIISDADQKHTLPLKEDPKESWRHLYFKSSISGRIK